MATTYLTRTFSTPTNRKIFTWSAWVKRQNQVSDHTNALFGAYLNSSVRSVFRFNAHKLNFQDTEASVEIRTNRLFRDVNAWYHIVLAVDTTQATSSDRVKLYVNGEQETSLDRTDYPAQNSDLLMGGADIHYINARNSTGSVESIADMSYSHIHFTDGIAYDASAFGQYDANGVWTIKTSPSVTYGNNGFFILKDGNSVTDQSGNSNNWTVGAGTLTNTEDNPSNVFATLNPLLYEARDNTFSNGNNTVTNAGANDWSNHYGSSTLAMSSGKWYVEAKVVTRVGSQAPLGIISTSEVINSSLQDDGMAAVISGGEISFNGSIVQSGLTAIASGDIIGAAFDATNGTLQFYRNGSTYGSQLTSIPSGEYYFTCNSYDGGQIAFNFGNGYFSTTAVASAGTNASGIGIFEYDVPTGYTALSTKGLNL